MDSASTPASRAHRRPVFTEKAAASLEDLLTRLSSMPEMASFEDGMAFCSAMVAYHKAGGDFRATIRARARSLRVLKPETKAIEYQGRTLALTAWCKELSLSYTTIYERMRRGKTFAEAVKQKERTQSHEKT